MKLFVEHLTVIDSAYLHAQHGIVGESWIVDATLHGELDPQSMVMDFAHVKKQLKAAIDNSIDHTLIVPASAPTLTQRTEGEQLVLHYGFGADETLEHRSPAQAVTLLDAPTITDASMIAWLEKTVMQAVPANVERVELQLRHEETGPAYYHYAHGLKKHDGNCQRIAHGHRSRIMIWENGTRSDTQERLWAADWNHAYLATEADVTGTDGANTLFGYRSDQGSFALSYPTARCRFLTTDTTVECIAQYIAVSLHLRAPQHKYRVRAYEGVHKGAIAEA